MKIKVDPKFSEKAWPEMGGVTLFKEGTVKLAIS